MATEVRLRGGTAAENDGFTGAPREVTVDTTGTTLRVHDGSTQGGTTLAKKADVTASEQAAKDHADTKASEAQAHAVQRANHTGTQLLSTISDAGTAARLSKGKVRWEAKAVGETFYIQDHLTGADVPPQNDSECTFIRLTASDSFNDGLLISETVSGSSPRITATAVIDLPGSPVNGETVNLINTERRFLRAGQSGSVQEDEFAEHYHDVERFNGGASGDYSTLEKIRAEASDAQFYPGGRTRNAGGNETRPRNIGATAYMRIK